MALAAKILRAIFADSAFRTWDRSGRKWVEVVALVKGPTDKQNARLTGALDHADNQRVAVILPKYTKTSRMFLPMDGRRQFASSAHLRLLCEWLFANFRNSPDVLDETERLGK